ncbi:hypothetical protein PTH_0385 [Pelotomaculum thermopropionicum SI]|uniref:Delta-aminolevulinic acid dehydratase n=1 Tax=Pelotomaculum thermopropionicum (strain DSM 13744 / JCM 10971 / SI) TaxID=370438 RepID=A5D5B2_PELTS|nr:hypothetical protein PTH_0385 [Pelotomaculum thermopropionicum SI]
MDFNLVVKDSIDRLFRWVKNENYLGWDPYDALNSNLVKKITRGNPYLEILSIQFNRYCPINLRPILQINKGLDLKGIALFAQAYAKLYKSTQEQLYKDELIKCISFIKEKSLKSKYNFHCWASHYFPYTSLDKSGLTKVEPDIIGTSQSIIALIGAYKILGDDSLKEIALDACNFIITQLIDKYEDNYFVKYTLTDDHKVVINASAQGLEAMCEVLLIDYKREIVEICESIVHFLIRVQNKDGSWDYSIYKNGKTRVQLDFHQGYIIDGLLAFYNLSQNKNSLYSYIEKGIKFYREVLFLEDGQSYYRYPVRFPIDIHNQAQGIITFTKASNFNANNKAFAKRIADWTLSCMQDRAGYFYYQKYRLFTNKIPYMRWGQAWMMLALSTLLESNGPL